MGEGLIKPAATEFQKAAAPPKAEPSKPDGQVEYRPAGAKDEKKYSQIGKKKK